VHEITVSARRSRAVAFALGLCWGLSLTTVPATAQTLNDALDHGCAISDFKTDGSIGARYNAATKTLAYGRPAADGHFHAYLSEADGSNERRLTYSGWPENRHQFVVEWEPKGRYLFVEVEKTEHRGSSRDAIPGYGAYTDLWLVSRDGKEAWKLVDLPNDYDHALTHAAITADGTQLTWTERVKRPNLFDANLWAGAYVFNVADFKLDPTPHLENIHAFTPGGRPAGGEVDGILSDGPTLAFYSTYKTRNLFATRIYTWNLTSGAIAELSTDSFAQAPRYTPDGRSLVYMSGSGADIFLGEIQGADWWFVRTDGTQRRRLTYMNKRGSPQSAGHYRLAGIVSFDSDRSFYGDVLLKPLGLSGKIVTVRCNEPF
jgi:hypothetical protein